MTIDRIIFALFHISDLWEILLLLGGVYSAGIFSAYLFLHHRWRDGINWMRQYEREYRKWRMS